ncbi:claudin-20-like [Nelusetta ayraudi]|uniref:claudin-20-like n=1 Tax=Nelusetta ayraudi TaxID=303726 RepID=UPI003F713B52
MLSTALQVLAFALALLGALGGAVATLLPNWAVSAESWSGSMSPVQQMQGLWLDCVWFSSGVFSCAAKTSALSLPAHLQATRAAMVLSCLVAALGLCLAALGLKCTRWGGGRRAKGHTAVAAGGCFVLAGLLCLAPASWFASEVVGAFLASDLPASSKYQPGGALCVTFVSAGFLLAGGVIFCMSCPGGGPRSELPGGGGGGCFPGRQDAVPAYQHQGPGQELQMERPKHRRNKSVRLQTDQDCVCERGRDRDQDRDRDRDKDCDCDCARVRDRDRDRDQKRDCVCDRVQNRDRAQDCSCDRDQDHASPSKHRSKDLKGSYVLQEYV